MCGGWRGCQGPAQGSTLRRLPSDAEVAFHEGHFGCSVHCGLEETKTVSRESSQGPTPVMQAGDNSSLFWNAMGARKVETKEQGGFMLDGRGTVFQIY